MTVTIFLMALGAQWYILFNVIAGASAIPSDLREAMRDDKAGPLGGGGKVVAGFASFKNHIAYLPHSGRVFDRLERELSGFIRTSGSLHCPVDRPLDVELIRALIEAKMQVLETDGQWTRP